MKMIPRREKLYFKGVHESIKQMKHGIVIKHVRIKVTENGNKNGSSGNLTREW